MNAVPLSLYIHFPWCIRKCPYCDFNSYQLNTPLDEDNYIDTLIQDLANDLHLVQNREIISIFMGGGTPSLFSPASMQRLLDTISSLVPPADDCEITMELNPGAVEHGNLAAYRAAGINRLSIGVQSFSALQLKNLGRVHTHTDAIEIVPLCKQAGFDNINLDLMYALSHQTVKQALDDLKQAIALEPQHLSWYHLTIEPNTEFYRRPPPIPNEDESADIEIAGKELLTKNNFIQYEVSAYAKNLNHPCKHNRNYWEFGDYLGIGAGAHSKITDLNTGIITRYWKLKTPRQYLSGLENYIAGNRTLTAADTVTEFMFNALRLTHGFSLELFEQRTCLDRSEVYPKLIQAANKNLLIITPHSISPSPLGARFLNNLIDFFTT